ncbi:MAG: thioesterase family protein [Novosphingobium sp.]|nr:thioesterase family protein [Novosphingobium sp.]
MAKPDPALLDPARYPFSCLVPPRYGDLDPNRHVNNVALTSILEEGRLRFHQACAAGASYLAWRVMTASSAVEYLGQVFYPDPLEIFAAGSTVGRSSFGIAQLAFQQGRPVAYAHTVMVWVDGESPCPIPDSFRAGMAPYMMRT